jgi:hypothetical protein
MMMLNPQPLPPRAAQPTIVEATNTTQLVPVGPRSCPTCTSGVFQLWDNAVAEWTVPSAG